MLLDIITTTQEIDYFSRDHWIVYGFLLLTLIVGLLAGRKIKDMDDYSVGGRSFDTMTLIFTFAATYIGSGTTVGGTERVFTDGIIMSVASFAATTVAFLFMAKLIGPKMERFEGCLTMGEVVGRLFGEGSRMVASIMGLLSTFFYGAAQTL
ncbi:MAG: hypothetical protein MI674_06700, partial [Cytophagales bacterium]|nr:hypothetical protein [Cytophagales bacterium]